MVLFFFLLFLIKTTIKALITIWAVFFTLNHSLAQDNSGFNTTFSAHFLNDTAAFELGKFGFNSLIISNNSAEEVYLRLQIDLPNGWDLLRDPQSTIRLAPFEQQIIPVRVRMGQKVYGGKVYLVKASLEDMTTGISLLSHFSVSLQQNPEWNARLLQERIFAGEDEGLPNFSFVISNSGNKALLFDFTLESELRLTLPSEGNQFILAPGEDSVVTIGIRSRMLNQTRDKIRIEISSGIKVVRLDQEILIISNTVKIHDKNRFLANSYFQLGAINALRPHFSFFTDLRTEVNFDKGRFLKLRARTFVNRGNVSLQNSNYTLQYETSNAGITLGSLHDFVYSQINGFGFRSNLKTNRQRFELFGVESIWHEGVDVGFRHDLKSGKNTNLHAEALYTRDLDNGMDYALAVENFKWNIDNKTTLQLKGGGSLSKLNSVDKNFNGYTVGYSFVSRKRAYSVNSYFNKSSGWFPGMNRGTESHNHDLLLYKGVFGLGAYGFLMTRKPVLFTNSFTSYKEVLFSRNYEYGVQTQVRAGRSNFLLKAGVPYLYQKSLGTNLEETIINPEIHGKKISLDYRFNSSKYTQQYLLSYEVNSLSEVGGSVVNDFESINLQMRGKLQSLGYQVRLQKGPTYFFDYLFFIRTGTPVFRQQYSMFWASRSDKNVRLNLAANYSEMKGALFNSLYLTSDLEFDIPSRDFNFRLSVNGNILGTNEVPLVSVALIKKFTSAVPFFKKYSTLTIKLFKDKNSNRVWDDGEEPVRNASVNVDGYYLRTNRSGETRLVNADRKTYWLDFKSVNNQIGWRAEKLLSDSINLSQDKEIILPFFTSKTITGEVTYSSAKYTNNSKVELNGITVTAVNTAGEKFTTITDSDGKFHFNIPPGEYQVSVDNAVTGSRFYFEKSMTKANILEQENAHVTFQLRERERRMNIKKLDD